MSLKYSLHVISLVLSGSLTAQVSGLEMKNADTVLIYNYVEQMPAPGFDLLAYISKNLQCPDDRRNQEIKGSYKVKFLVNESGIFTDVSLINGDHGYCDDEVIRMVQNMPRWKPGKKNGKSVKVWYKLPVIIDFN